MSIRKHLVLGWIVLLVAGFAASSQAGTYGASGDLDGVDLVNNTIQVGRYTLEVSGSSAMKDRFGRLLSLSDLEDMEGPVNVTMYKVGDRYLLRTLEFYDPEGEG